MLNVVRLSVVMKSVTMLSVVASYSPKDSIYKTWTKGHFAEIHMIKKKKFCNIGRRLE
jgi:hypothetical protein